MNDTVYFKILGLFNVKDEVLTHCLQNVRGLIQSMAKKINLEQ